MVRARDLGIIFDGTPGSNNSITDVRGVEVGHSTIIRGNGDEAVRTGVTAILPQGKKNIGSNVFSGASVLNGNGEVTGLAWLHESGILSGPVMLTNTYSVGIVRDSVLKYLRMKGIESEMLPVVGEISDQFLNDIGGQHVTENNVFEAIESSQSGQIEEGNAGGGTGAMCYRYKGGIGSSSRTVSYLGEEYMVGVLVQANHGLRHQLRVMGSPVEAYAPQGDNSMKELGSIVIVVGTDAPLLPHQLVRLSRRAFLGLARTGGVSSNGSGDFSIAFSTAQSFELAPKEILNSRWIPNGEHDELFEAAVYATVEAIINALVAAESMTGYKGHKADSLSHDAIRRLVKMKG